MRSSSSPTSSTKGTFFRRMDLIDTCLNLLFAPGPKDDVRAGFAEHSCEMAAKSRGRTGDHDVLVVESERVQARALRFTRLKFPASTSSELRRALLEECASRLLEISCRTPAMKSMPSW